MTQKLPLFPLNTVLFPGATLRLNIFEERYKQMITRCIESQTPFGVVLIHEGLEVGGPAVPHMIGTVAHISEHVRMEDGRYFLTTIGQSRFRVQYLLQRQPYLVASTAKLPEESIPDVGEAARELASLYRRYWETMQAATGFLLEGEDLSANPVEMSYQLAHRVQVDNERKQRWLEADTLTRLRELRVLLTEELALRPISGSVSPRTWRGSGSWN